MKDIPHENHAVGDYIASLGDEQALKDSQILTEIMADISGCAPKIWNIRAIGFGTYHYKYATGREGDNFVMGFYPRKGKITIYIMDGTTRYAKLLDKLGKHTISGYCIIMKHLDDVDVSVLKEILQHSYENIKTLSKDGPIDRILWQTER